MALVTDLDLCMPAWVLSGRVQLNPAASRPRPFAAPAYKQRPWRLGHPFSPPGSPYSHLPTPPACAYPSVGQNRTRQRRLSGFPGFLRCSRLPTETQILPTAGVLQELTCIPNKSYAGRSLGTSGGPGCGKRLAKKSWYTGPSCSGSQRWALCRAAVLQWS